MRSSQLVLALAAFLPVTLGHVALWDEGMYGWDPNDPNQNGPVNPLMNLTEAEWWFHGYIDILPPTGAYMTLPAGGTYHGEVACNKALTSYGDNPPQQTGLYACDTIGPLHTADAWASPNPTDVKGCGIAIAYQSDVSLIKPEDFAVISVNYTCPWSKDVDFQIPSDLPPCPEGGCHCMWGWIHSADSGSEQMYFVGYRCNVTGATGTEAIPAPNIANKCDYPTDTSNCTVGAKQPHYWFQAEGNNNPQGTYDPPFYNGAYGFMNGAQTDLFAAVSVSSESTVSSTSTTQSSTSASSTSVASSSSTTSSTPSAVTTSSTSSVSATARSTSTLVAQAAVASTTLSSSSSSSSTSTTASTTSLATSKTSTASCKRRRRALSNLSSPETLKRHQDRQARRAKKRAIAHEQDLARVARAHKVRRVGKERSELGLRSLEAAQD